MPRGVKKYFSTDFPSLSELGRTTKIPELPKSYRQSLWRTIKVKTALTLPEETEHFMNILCLHFGLSRNDLVIHAINLLWAEIVDSVGADRIQVYEEKLEAVRLWRLQNREAKSEKGKKILAEALNKMSEEGKKIKTNAHSVGTPWCYKPNVSVRHLARESVDEAYDDETQLPKAKRSKK